MVKRSDASRATGEDHVRSWFLEMGIPVFTRKNVPKVGVPILYVVEQELYRKCYERNTEGVGSGRIDFMCYDTINNVNVRIEIKNQDWGGSVCEKYVANVEHACSQRENEVGILVLEGAGIPGAWRKFCEDKALEYREGRGSFAVGVPKMFYVFSLEQFKIWFQGKFDACTFQRACLPLLDETKCVETHHQMGGGQNQVIDANR